MNDDLRGIVLLWIEKAREDWTTVEILMKNEYYPKDVVCFHCQQYVEKLLKAYLTACNIEAPKTHDLRRLIQLSVDLPELSDLLESADELTEYGVQSRYPDLSHSIDQNQLEQAVETTGSFAALLEPAISEMF